jgi:hypothetical protein
MENFYFYFYLFFKLTYLVYSQIWWILLMNLLRLQLHHKIESRKNKYRWPKWPFRTLGWARPACARAFHSYRGKAYLLGPAPNLKTLSPKAEVFKLCKTCSKVTLSPSFYVQLGTQTGVNRIRSPPEVGAKGGGLLVPITPRPHTLPIT